MPQQIITALHSITILIVVIDILIYEIRTNKKIDKLEKRIKDLEEKNA